MKDYGDWQIIESLKEGGQAYTYLVKDKTRNNHKKYVLKRLKNLKRIDRFITEIETVKKLSHPNIIHILDFNYNSKNPYMVTEYFPNGTLEDLDITKLKLNEKLYLILHICEGVAHAHQNGVIHRDLKPANIFIGDNFQPVIGDFGICFVDDAGERFTITEEAVGPRYYMAPELEDGRLEQISNTTDIYSLGKLIYWILSGRIFSREKHRDKDFNLSKDQRSSEFFIINELLDNMIVANPNKRYQNVEEVIENLKSTIERIEMKAHVIDFNVPQQCMYCSKGFYQIAVTENSGQQGMDVGNFGFRAVGNPRWNILVCDHCGNVQIFRTDYAKNPDIWKKT